MSTRKVFRALSAGSVEKLFIGRDEPAPAGWYETQAEALEAFAAPRDAPPAAHGSAAPTPDQTCERCGHPESAHDLGRHPEQGCHLCACMDFRAAPAAPMPAAGPVHAPEPAPVAEPEHPVRRGPDRHRRGR